MTDETRFGHIKANIVLYGALFANLGIAIAKFIAAAGAASRAVTDDFDREVEYRHSIVQIHGEADVGTTHRRALLE